MRIQHSALRFAALLLSALATVGVGPVHSAELIANGGFESGLSGWTTVDLLGSDGTFQLQSGLASPVNSVPVPAPPGGSFAAMSDAQGPGSHVLYQDIFIPVGFTEAELRFDLYLGNRADDFFIPDPDSLDFSIAAFNQQARVDILLAGADPFSTDAGDILMNLYRTLPGDAPVSSYTTIVADLSSLVSSLGGQTIRLRFAETDNVDLFQLGVDNVSLNAIPEPSSLLLAAVGVLVCVAGLARRRRVGIVG